MIELIPKSSSQVIKIEEKTAFRCKLLKHIIEDSDENEPREPINLDLDEIPLSTVLMFLKYHESGVPYGELKQKPMRDPKEFESSYCEWDKEFLRAQSSEGLSLLNDAAEYLQCEVLLELINSFVAAFIKEARVEEIFKEMKISEKKRKELEQKAEERLRAMDSELKAQFDLK